MGVILNRDRTHYRRWLNVFAALCLAGTGQFLSGRRRAGVVWLIADPLFVGLLATCLACPALPLSLRAFAVLYVVFEITMIVDACRAPMLRRSAWFWPLFICSVIVLKLALMGAVGFLGHTYTIPTNAMLPTLRGAGTDEQGRPHRGDFILANRIVYRFNEPQRGDIIVFDTTGIHSAGVREHDRYVKRLAGLPGDHVRIESPWLVVNGERVQSPPFFRAMGEQREGLAGYSPANYLNAALKEGGEIHLGPDEYFVLGDASERSLDSRYFGPIKRSVILERAELIYSPVERKRWLR